MKRDWLEVTQRVLLVLLALGFMALVAMTLT